MILRYGDRYGCEVGPTNMSHDLEYKKPHVAIVTAVWPYGSSQAVTSRCDCGGTWDWKHHPDDYFQLLPLRVKDMEPGVAYRIEGAPLIEDRIDACRPQHESWLAERAYLLPIEYDPFRMKVLDAVTGKTYRLGPEAMLRAEVWVAEPRT